MKIRVLVVDDSLLFRNMIQMLLKTDNLIEVVGEAKDAFEAREKLIDLKPDVMTLDLLMPYMNGLEFLEKVMEHFPVKTIVISSIATPEAHETFRAIELGALEILEKPNRTDKNTLIDFGKNLIEKIKIISRSNFENFKKFSRQKELNIVKTISVNTSLSTKIIAIVSSTGGTEALKMILSQLPLNLPPIIIVQHMPAVFTKIFANSLSKICCAKVKEAENNEQVKAGVIYIVPGNYHLEIQKNGGNFIAKLNQNPQVNGVRPSGDILLKSVAKAVGKQALGIILTGMGKDGAEGLLEIKKAGGFTFAQDEKTSVVFGMPKEAIKLGAVSKVISLETIPLEILSKVNSENTLEKILSK